MQKSNANSCSVEGPVPGDAFIGGAPLQFELSSQGYLEEEFFLSGEATSYEIEGDFPTDGRASVTEKDTAPFVTRILVRRPANANHFNGTVIVEWLNVTAGTDIAPDFNFAHRHLFRAGFAWVGVSAQHAGLFGLPEGDALMQPVCEVAPERYKSLVHPGDAFSYDIFSQVGHILRNQEGTNRPLGPLQPQTYLAIGESQSAGFMVTYANAIDPIDQVYDGYMIHGRPGRSSEMNGFRLSSIENKDQGKGVIIRQDMRVPVITVQSETDLMILQSVAARQPDHEHHRLWEIAGAAHADAYLMNYSGMDLPGADLALFAKALEPKKEFYGMELNEPMNTAPQQHYIIQAAIAHLNRWARDGMAPPKAPLLELSGTDQGKFSNDAHGNVSGGIRTPWVDVPLAKLSGLDQGGPSFARLFGTTTPFDADKIAALYPTGKIDYLAAFEKSLANTIGAGFILEADRAEILELAGLMYPIS